MEVTQQDLQVMMAVLRENRTEECLRMDKVGRFKKKTHNWVVIDMEVWTASPQ